MKNNEKIIWVSIGLLLFGMAIEWFIGGNYKSYSNTRNVFVVIQLIIGIGIALYPYIKKNAKN